MRYTLFFLIANVIKIDGIVKKAVYVTNAVWYIHYNYK